MQKKKVLVYGSLESLHNFFSDKISCDYEVVAALSDEPEKISFTRNGEPLEIFAPQNLPNFIYELVDGIIFTNFAEKKDVIKNFLAKKFSPQKIILWNAQKGWGTLNLHNKDGTQIVYFCGLEFHIRNENDLKFFYETFSRLQNQRKLKNLNPKLYPAFLEKNFQQITGKPLDFKNLQTFTEKLQWIKVFDATPLKSRLADKYLVRSWVAEKIGEEYLIPLLGVWDNFDDIDFDALPNQFVLKCNHGSAMNIICRDKKTFDKQRAREKINAWLAFDFATLSTELHYTRINRKIIAEKFMVNGDNTDLTDYKFVCFNGKAPYCKATTERSTFIRCTYFDMNWQYTNFSRNDYPMSDHPERISKPKNFELMKKLAAKLSEGFAHVRVDFYEIQGKVYFGEMTFTPGAGNFCYKSAGTDEFLGNLLKLPELTLPPKLFNSVDYRVRQKFLT